MITTQLPTVPRVTLGRTGIVSTRLGLGCANWPLKRPYEQVVETLRTAFSAGIRHLDNAPLYGTEEIIGRALQDAEAPDDIVLSTKTCSYHDDLGIFYQEYSADTVYRSVEKSLKRLQVDRLDIVHIHDAEPDSLPRIFANDGALHALLDLKEQGVIRSIGIAAISLECLQVSVDSGDIDHIQFYHNYTLLNRDTKREVIPTARAKNLSILNNAPYAGYILQTGCVPNAHYNYRPAKSAVVAAVQRLESVCAAKGVSLATAALAFSLMDPDIDVTIVGASSPERVRERVAAFGAPLIASDFKEMLSAVGGSFPVLTFYPTNPLNVSSQLDELKPR